MLRRWLMAVTIAMLCGCGTAPNTTVAPARTLTKVTVAMPYIPSVQFAHFYVAVSKGYYTAEGLDVAFDYKFETDAVTRVAQGGAQFGLASGDSVLLARAQGLPIVAVAANSQRFATVFFSKVAANITKPDDLKGKTVGIPGRFGAAYIGLQALLYATKIQERDLSIQAIGFTQVAALAEDKVQVASGYGNNEPLQLDQQGVKLNIIEVADFYPLAGDGVITSEKLISEQPDLVRAFIRATFKGMQDVIANPDDAYSIMPEFIPELKTADAATNALQRRVLAATIPYWQSDLTNANGLGYIDDASWQATSVFLRDSDLLTSDVDVAKAYTNSFLK